MRYHFVAAEYSLLNVFFCVCRDIRENFIRAKYELKAWIPRSPSSPPEVLGKQLCDAVKTDNVMTSLELIIRGANVCVCVCFYLLLCNVL